MNNNQVLDKQYDISKINELLSRINVIESVLMSNKADSKLKANCEAKMKKYIKKLGELGVNMSPTVDSKKSKGKSKSKKKGGQRGGRYNGQNIQGLDDFLSKSDELINSFL